MSWFDVLVRGLGCALVLGWAMQAVAEPTLRKATMNAGELVSFAKSPYPFTDGRIPGDGVGPDTPFFQTDTDGRRYHLAPRGGRLFEDRTYSDNKSLLYVPPRFDPRAPEAFILLFLHGNLATLSRDVALRQGVPRQLRASQRNAVLVAPQLAVDALDSSPGHFYDRGFFGAYMREAAQHIGELSGGRLAAADIDRLPIVIVAYSGGYLATAFSLHYATPGPSRIAGVILLDALFGEVPKFEDWLVRPEARAAFFVSAYSRASAALNGHLEEALRNHQDIRVETSLPKTIKPGDVIFRDAGSVGHNEFVTQAWTKDPLADVLRRVALRPPASAP